VLYFRRKVMVPKRGTVDEQPGRPEPAPGNSHSPSHRTSHVHGSKTVP
jgi:hypothetical protein